MDKSSAFQEQVVLDECGQIQFWDHPVYSPLQEAPESAACQVLQGARGHGQREDGFKELSVLLVGLNIKYYLLSYF